MSLSLLQEHHTLVMADSIQHTDCYYFNFMYIGILLACMSEHMSMEAIKWVLDPLELEGITTGRCELPSCFWKVN